MNSTPPRAHEAGAEGAASEPKPSRRVFTVGHSSRDPEEFVCLLRHAGIESIVDVRSVPYSRRFPQFNRDRLRELLRRAAIRYAFLGEALGARPEDVSVYVDGQVSYAALRERPEFRRGLAQVVLASENHALALLCAEEDPARCHRGILIGTALAENGVEVFHLRADGRVESQAELERRLSGNLQALPGFESDAVRLALERRERRIAWRARPGS